jgi:glycerol uptake facilitator-like aquaporin
MLRRVIAEGLGSLLLAATVIGSGIMAERLAAGNFAVALIANTGAMVAVLATLIALLGPVSGAHFNLPSLWFERCAALVLARSRGIRCHPNSRLLRRC